MLMLLGDPGVSWVSGTLVDTEGLPEDDWHIGDPPPLAGTLLLGVSVCAAGTAPDITEFRLIQTFFIMIIFTCSALCAAMFAFGVKPARSQAFSLSLLN